jgi:hypothetical protein
MTRSPAFHDDFLTKPELQTKLKREQDMFVERLKGGASNGRPMGKGKVRVFSQ